MRRIVALSVVLAGCPLPEKPEAVDDDTVATEAPTLAGCTVTMTDETGAWTEVYDETARPIAFTSSWTYEDGSVHAWETTSVWDAAGCPTRLDETTTTTEYDGDRVSVSTQGYAIDRACDEHANAIHDEVATSETYTRDGTVYYEDAWDSSIDYENTYEDDLLTKLVSRDQDGNGYVDTTVYDEDDLPVAGEHYSDPDGETLLYTWVEAWADGLEQRFTYTYWDGTVDEYVYSYDHLGRMTTQTATSAETVTVSTFAYADDDWPWPATVAVTVDGVATRAGTYTYECP